MKYAFQWDRAKNQTNRSKHGIEFRKATEVFRDPLAISIFDEEHSFDEDRWITTGQTQDGMLLVVIHTFEQTEKHRSQIRIISARRATTRERRHYEDEA